MGNHDIFGCYIDPTHLPPKGYRCNCRYFLGCWGVVQKCDESELNDPACSGCQEKRCCSESNWNGNCNGYFCRPYGPDDCS